MEPYAVVETSGKQYLVKAKDRLVVDRQAVEKGQSLDMNEVLAVSDGAKLTVGAPLVAGAKVVATVVDHMRGPKVRSFKKRRRKGYARRVGHRQELTVLRIESLG
jgi:large subunit ribosomal protein L21